jgi:hypothetical protein
MIAWQMKAPVGPSALRQAMTFGDRTPELEETKHDNTHNRGES